MAPSEGGTATSQSLERGLAILSSFDSDRPLIGVSELSRELELSRSTAHRYVATLAKLGYLQQDPDRGATGSAQGARPRLLGDQLDGRPRDLRPVSPTAQRRDRHTVNLAILDGIEVVYIERCRTARPGQRDIDLNLHVGARLRPTAPRWGRRSWRSSPRTTSRSRSSASIHATGAEHAHRPEAFREELPGSAPRASR